MLKEWKTWDCFHKNYKRCRGCIETDWCTWLKAIIELMINRSRSRSRRESRLGKVSKSCRNWNRKIKYIEFVDVIFVNIYIEICLILFIWLINLINPLGKMKNKYKIIIFINPIPPLILSFLCFPPSLNNRFTLIHCANYWPSPYFW